MVYHSAWNGFQEGELCGCGIFPVKFSREALQAGAGNGPAKRMDAMQRNDETGEQEVPTDIIDEVLYYFKANMLFRAYNVKGSGDRVLLYLTLFTQQCLRRLVGVTQAQAQGALIALAIEQFSCPGDAGFTFGSFFPAPQTPQEREKWVEYIKQLRLELAMRLISKVFRFPQPGGIGNKYWLIYCRGAMLNKAFEK